MTWIWNHHSHGYCYLRGLRIQSWFMPNAFRLNVQNGPFFRGTQTCCLWFDTNSYVGMLRNVACVRRELWSLGYPSSIIYQMEWRNKTNKEGSRVSRPYDCFICFEWIARHVLLPIWLFRKKHDHVYNCATIENHSVVGICWCLYNWCTILIMDALAVWEQFPSHISCSYRNPLGWCLQDYPWDSLAQHNHFRENVMLHKCNGL